MSESRKNTTEFYLIIVHVNHNYFVDDEFLAVLCLQRFSHWNIKTAEGLSAQAKTEVFSTTSEKCNRERSKKGKIAVTHP
mgnify:CR=1 FL=1